MSQTQRQTIAVDIDDVLADTTGTLQEYVNERFKLKLTPEHYRIQSEYWGYYERVWQEHNLTDEGIFDDFSEEMIKDQTKVLPLSGASLAIKELSKKFNIIVITARDSAWEDQTKRWLGEHFSAHTISIYFTKNHKDKSAKNKGELCRELGASVLIDDNTAHCQTAIELGIDAVLFGDYGWQLEIPNGVTRCKNWEAVLDYFNGR